MDLEGINGVVVGVSGLVCAAASYLLPRRPVKHVNAVALGCVSCLSIAMGVVGDNDPQINVLAIRVELVADKGAQENEDEAHEPVAQTCTVPPTNVTSYCVVPPVSVNSVCRVPEV